jgi:hypothetical protein
MLKGKEASPRKSEVASEEGIFVNQKFFLEIKH